MFTAFQVIGHSHFWEQRLVGALLIEMTWSGEMILLAERSASLVGGRVMKRRLLISLANLSIAEGVPSLMLQLDPQLVSFACTISRLLANHYASIIQK